MNAPATKREIKPNPNAAILEYLRACIEKTEDPLMACHYAHAAEPAYRHDWGQFAEDTPEEDAHYDERRAIFEPLVTKLEDLLLDYQLRKMTRVGYVELIHGSLPEPHFNSGHPDDGLCSRLIGLRQRLETRIGQLTIQARMPH